MRTKIYIKARQRRYLFNLQNFQIIEVNDSDSFVTNQTMEYLTSLEDFALALQTEPKKLFQCLTR
jgi:hypothetical protein